MPQYPLVTLSRAKVSFCIYGSDERAVEAGNLLKEHLDVTVLIKPPATSRRRAVTEFPVVKGTIRSAKGHLGAFELTVDDYAHAAPSSRGELAFGPAPQWRANRAATYLSISSGEAAAVPGG